jgi:nucleoside-diphosphate-sugar epimerase
MYLISALITGINGFSGSRVKDLLQRSKIDCIGVSRKYERNNTIKWDLTKKNNKKLNFKINWVIHSAAIHKIADFSKKFNNNKKKNILMTKNLIEFSKKNNIKNIIFFSTIDLSYNNISGIKKNYNLSKIKSEEIILEAYKKKIFEKVVILRVPAILGIGANENFIVNTIKNLKKNQDIFINDKLKYNNFVHIKDLCSLILKILTSCNMGKNKKSYFFDVINCLSSNYIHISKKIKTIKKKLNSNSKINIVKQGENYKILERKKNRFNFKFMSCNRAIKLCC